MRKITKEAVDAFINCVNYKNSNTEVLTIGPDSSMMLLHNNLIASKTPNGIKVSLAGWNTPTTRERLNGIPGVIIYTRKGQAYLNGNPINSDEFYTI